MTTPFSSFSPDLQLLLLLIENLLLATQLIKLLILQQQIPTNLYLPDMQNFATIYALPTMQQEMQ